MKRDRSKTEEFSKSDELFEEIIGIALQEDQRRKKAKAPVTKPDGKPQKPKEKARVQIKKPIKEPPPLRRLPPDPKEKGERKAALLPKPRSRRLTILLSLLLLLVIAVAAAVLVMPDLKWPGFAPDKSSEKPPPITIAMPTKPAAPEVAQAPSPSQVPDVGSGHEARSPEADPAPTSYPYAIYLGSFRREDALQKAMETSRKRGLSPYPVRMDLGDKGIWFRVFAGYFETREKSDAFIQQHQVPDGETRNTRFAVLIGTYASRPEAETRARFLASKGCYPYIIEDGPAHLRIYTGAFYREEDAKGELSWLASKGISGKVVTR